MWKCLIKTCIAASSTPTLRHTFPRHFTSEQSKRLCKNRKPIETKVDHCSASVYTIKVIQTIQSIKSQAAIRPTPCDTRCKEDRHSRREMER